MAKTSLHPILSEADIQTLVARYLADPIFDNRRDGAIKVVIEPNGAEK